MGWLFSIATLMVGLKLNSDALIVVAGLYSIAGAIAFKNFNIPVNTNKTQDRTE